MHVVGEQLPDVTVVDLGPAEPAALERDALRVEHPQDVVVGRDEELPGGVEPRSRVGEEPQVDVPVRADDREVGDAAVQVEADRRRLDVAVGPQTRHSPSPGFGMSTESSGNRSSASSSARYPKPAPSTSARESSGPGA